MIIAVSIVDTHKPARQGHIGTYHFEIDRPNDSHFDFLVMTCPPENEHEVRHMVGKLVQVEDMPDPVHPDGSSAFCEKRIT